ncbi:hypothetical protein [Streptococcus halichoeri]|uniref:hypothetical protein n=1 Tax=Streptococcus halichoeri TaxID=254785 RepID=UPI000DAFEC03|nr:hypothetical protein [Streptococcus halichoeri]PZO96030.1 MAG: hypothetical protein DI617_02015 [Streptococcus pyogenes]
MLKKKRTQVMLACLSLVILGLCLWAPEAVSANTDGSLWGYDESLGQAILGAILTVVMKFVDLIRGLVS